MRWSRTMQTLLKLGFVLGVCSSLWVIYDKEAVVNSIDASVQFLGNYVDLSAFGVSAKSDISRDAGKDRIKKKENSEFDRKDETKGQSETISSQIKRKEEEERIIQDEAIRKAAEIAERNRKKDEQRLANEIERKETERLKKQKEDVEHSMKQKEDTDRLKRLEKEKLKKKKDEDKSRKLEEETELLKRQEEERLKKQNEDEENSRKQKEETDRLKGLEKEKFKKKKDEEKSRKQKEESERLQRHEDERLKKQNEEQLKRTGKADKQKKGKNPKGDKKVDNSNKQSNEEKVDALKTEEEERKRREHEHKLAMERIEKAKQIVQDNIKRQSDLVAVEAEAIKLNHAEILKKKAELDRHIKEAKERAEIEQKIEMKRFYESKKKEKERTQEDWKKEQEQRGKEVRVTQEDKRRDDERRAPEWKKAEDYVNELRVSRRGNAGVAVPDVHLAVVACGDRLEETVVLLKSARVLSQAHLHFHVFADDDLLPIFKTELAAWPEEALAKTTYHIRPLSFPAGNSAEWKKLFKPCASQRLFLPNILLDEDAVLYVDTDILFLTPPEDLWSLFNVFNSTQIAGLTPEHEDASAGWYNRFARHPYYPPLGLNSGVMLMNLTRMREVGWVDRMLPYHAEYKYRITWGDQCLINIFFHFYPQMVYVYPCHWNFRPDHCMYMSKCKQAEDHGVYIVHGNRRVWFEDKQPAFKAIYTAFKQYTFTGDLQKDLLDKLREHITKPESKSSNCGRLHEMITRPLENEIGYIAKSSKSKVSNEAKTEKR